MDARVLSRARCIDMIIFHHLWDLGTLFLLLECIEQCGGLELKTKQHLVLEKNLDRTIQMLHFTAETEIKGSGENI